MKPGIVSFLLNFIAALILLKLHQPYWVVSVIIITVWIAVRTTSTMKRGARIMLAELIRHGHFIGAMQLWLFMLVHGRRTHHHSPESMTTLVML